mgnify:CR=1 FL=1|jgi:hypothetical protein|tara:strand:- start:4664 stop:4813 length:150 start_codon:yes stop_codon:yes gene_type:complete
MAEIKDIANELRDIINWVVVFEKEYNIPKEAVDQLRSRLEKVAADIGVL